MWFFPLRPEGFWDAAEGDGEIGTERQRDRETEDRSQKSEVRSQKSEVRNQRAEDRGQNSCQGGGEFYGICQGVSYYN